MCPSQHLRSCTTWERTGMEKQHIACNSMSNNYFSVLSIDGFFFLDIFKRVSFRWSLNGTNIFFLSCPLL
jgi:hypothetical protein